MYFFVFVYSVVNVFLFLLDTHFFVYLFGRIFVLCGVFYIGTTHDFLCPFYRVLLILDFLTPALIFDDDSLVDYFATSWMS